MQEAFSQKSISKFDAADSIFLYAQCIIGLGLRNEHLQTFTPFLSQNSLFTVNLLAW